MQQTIYNLGWPTQEKKPEFFTNVPQFQDIKNMLEERYPHYIDAKKKYETESEECRATSTRLHAENSVAQQQIQHTCYDDGDEDDDYYSIHVDCQCKTYDVNKGFVEIADKIKSQLAEQREKGTKLEADYRQLLAMIESYSICHDRYSVVTRDCNRNNRDWFSDTPRGPHGITGPTGPTGFAGATGPYGPAKGCPNGTSYNYQNIGDPTNFFMRIGVKTTWKKINNVRFRPYKGNCDFYNILWNNVDGINLHHIKTEETKTVVKKPYFSEIFGIIKEDNPNITREELLKHPYDALFVDHVEYDAKSELLKSDDTPVTYYFNFRYDNIVETISEILPEIDYLMDYTFVKKAI